MKKMLSSGFATIASLILIIAIVFTTMQTVIGNETFINNEFTKLGVNKAMNMSNADLVRSFNQLVQYMEGDADSIELTVTVNGEKTNMFSLEQEVTHMKDVRTIYLTIKQYRDIGVLVMLVLFLLAAVVNFRRAPQTLAQGFLSGAFIAILIFGFLGTWAAMDFTNFWTFFHQMLFWNDLWLFDATESRMINMLPEQMFADIVGQIFLYAGILIGALIALSVFAVLVSSESHKKKRAAARSKKRAGELARQTRAEERAAQKAAKEKAKRIAAKKAAKAKARQKRAAEEERAAKAAERAAQKAARHHAKKSRDESGKQGGEPILVDDLLEADETPEEGAQAERPRKKSARDSVADDTGFLDDDV